MAKGLKHASRRRGQLRLSLQAAEKRQKTCIKCSDRVLYTSPDQLSHVLLQPIGRHSVINIHYSVL